MTFRTTGHILYQTARKIVIAVIGITLLLFGTIMLITPGPGIVVIIAGLGILGLEFAWAKRWLRIVKERSQDAAHKAGESNLWQRFRCQFTDLMKRLKGLLRLNP